MIEPNARRLLAGAGALVLAGSSAGALAHPHPDGDGKTVERIVIVRDGGHHSKGEHRRVRRVEVHGDGLVECAGGDKIVDESAVDGDRKTKVVVCTKGASSTETAARLEEALARIAANDDLSDEQKAKIETALRSAIDRARSAR